MAVTILGNVKERQDQLFMQRHVKRLLGLRPQQTTEDAEGRTRIALQFEDTRYALRFLLKVFDLRVEGSHAAWAIVTTKQIPLTSAAIINIETPPPTPKRKREITPPSTPTQALKRRKISDIVELSSSPLFGAKPVPRVIDLTSPIRVAAGPLPESARTKPKSTQLPVPSSSAQKVIPAASRKTRADVTAGATERANIRRQAKADSKAANSEKGNAQPTKSSAKGPRGNGGGARPQSGNLHPCVL